jgi:lactoylglutathione lyase
MNGLFNYTVPHVSPEVREQVVSRESLWSPSRLTRVQRKIDGLERKIDKLSRKLDRLPSSIPATPRVPCVRDVGAIASLEKGHSMELGNFSISLAVKDLAASRAFYEKFGFKAFAGDPSQNWLIMKNGDHAIGLFQGMFEKNILTFNPGWNSNAQKLPAFTDIRELQRRLSAQGVELQQRADESSTGPASFIAVDPDGNPILVDQHV